MKLFAAMKELTKAMCWELVSINKDTVNGVSAAIYRKPTNNDCYQQRPEKEPPVCPDSDDPNAAWYLSVMILISPVNKCVLSSYPRSNYLEKDSINRASSPESFPFVYAFLKSQSLD